MNHIQKRICQTVAGVLVLALVLAGTVGAEEINRQSTYATDLSYFNGHYYQLIEAYDIAWAEANADANAAVLNGCESAHLVTITSQAEGNALYLFFGDALDGKWYGGFQDDEETDPAAGWNWVTGETWEYTNWGGEEPNDAYGSENEQYLAGSWGGMWNDASGNLWGYVIEYEQCARTPIVTGGGWIYSPLYTGLPYSDGSYYQLADTYSWYAANAAAQAAVLEGCEVAHLAVITSQDENDAIYSFFGDSLYGKWYGGFQNAGETDPAAGWNWVTGEPWDYTNWVDGEPNDASFPGAEQYLAGSYEGGWNDEGYTENISGYLVEFEQCDSSASTDLPSFNGHYYQLMELDGIAWDAASTAASAADLEECENAHLVTIKSQEEQDALYGFFQSALQGKWYGGFQNDGETDPAAGWNWVTGEPWDYTNWAYWEPDDYYGMMNEQYLAGTYDGTWMDAMDNLPGYIIEYEGCGPESKANFGFVSNTKVATEFQFKAADLNFHSTSHGPLLVINGNYAVIEGEGTINGKGRYNFKIWAGDGTGAGGADTFRIKIWEEEESGRETVRYDTLRDLDISGGSIVVHRK